ncbi:hypothetical protein [Actinoplanes sp. L3-i22]|uniref:fascin domain-containing protein n=1 Tax=Actinoplanes sp. L3-i22 TaxID=2836373 RepID=UPI001C78A27B|nr:hypothetical protein [Actinoplanes sp. L3-i22]BCY09104.1 hypothetical protein L3i22_041920 [Actinoplanes sp. L3-i22]
MRKTMPRAAGATSNGTSSQHRANTTRDSIVRSGRILVAVLSAAVMAVVATPADARAGSAGRSPSVAAVSCLPQQVTLQSSRNLKYVSVEKDYTGTNYAMLRARADSVGPWEDFRLCSQDGFTTVALLATTNNRYVAAEFDYAGSRKGMLRARSTSIGQWESFVWTGGGDAHRMQYGAARLYVAAELDYTGSQYAMLRARSTSPGIWEEWTIRW